MKFKFNKYGNYGIHNGFFNAIAVIDNEEYDLQCCTEKDGTIDFNDCGFNEGMSEMANEKAIEKFGEEKTLKIIKKAYTSYLSQLPLSKEIGA